MSSDIASEQYQNRVIVMEQEEIPIGYGNDQFLKINDGYYYRGFFQINLDFLGVPFVYLEHIDIQTYSEFRVTYALRVSDADGAQMRNEAYFTYGPDHIEITMTISDHTGKSTNSYFNWDGIRPIYFESTGIQHLLS